MKYLILMLLLLAMPALISGCGQAERGPTLAGGREVASWLADLNGRNPKVRRQAVLKLGNVGDADPAAAEGLASALRDSDVLVRRDAVHAVVKLKQPTEAILARLEEMSQKDPDTTARDFANRALAKLGRSH